MSKNKIIVVLVICALIIGGMSVLKKDNTATSKADESTTKEVYKENNGEEETFNENVKEENASKSENVVYVSASKLNVRKEADKNATTVGSLMKGSPVKIIDQATTENNHVWYQIELETPNGKELGWITSEYTVKDRMELLSESLRVLDFSPQKKAKEYPNNPRVKVKGVYMTQHSFIGAKFDKLLKLAQESDINAFVIDVKDDDGIMLFENEAAAKYSPEGNSRARINVEKLNERMKILKDNGIYTIARIVTFKDPMYTKAHPDRAILDKRTGNVFVSKDKLRWASPHDRELWNYDIAVAKEAAKNGFNEIQFDYVRFPASNGNKLDKVLDYRNNVADKSKPQTIQNFLKQAYAELSKEQVYISADIFGLVGSVSDDMGLGQHWEAVSNVTDYVCPMMYPSHYGKGTYGQAVPDARPYETVYFGTKDAVGRNKTIETPAMIRPWIQDFTAGWVKGHIKYRDQEVRAQINALKDNGVEEYLLWNASNRYSEGAVKN